MIIYFTQCPWAVGGSTRASTWCMNLLEKGKSCVELQRDDKYEQLNPNCLYSWSWCYIWPEVGSIVVLVCVCVVSVNSRLSGCWTQSFMECFCLSLTRRVFQTCFIRRECKGPTPCLDQELTSGLDEKLIPVMINQSSALLVLRFGEHGLKFGQLVRE